MKNNSALFYTCSLIEFIGRERKLKRSELVQFFGKKVIERIYRYADVFHCEPIEKTADDFITTLIFHRFILIMCPPAVTMSQTIGPLVRCTND